MKKIRVVFFLLFASAITIPTNCHAENVFFAVTNSVFSGDNQLAYPVFSKGNAIAAKKNQQICRIDYSYVYQRRTQGISGRYLREV